MEQEKKYTYFELIVKISKLLNTRALWFDIDSYDKGWSRPEYGGGYIINISNFDEEKKSFDVTFEKNGTWYTHDFFVEESNDEYMEYLYKQTFKFFIGEDEMTEEEFWEDYNNNHK